MSVLQGHAPEAVGISEVQEITCKRKLGEIDDGYDTFFTGTVLYNTYWHWSVFYFLCCQEWQ